MAGSGLILMYPVIATDFLPGWIVPVALVAHSDEAVLAVAWILVVHLFFGHLHRPMCGAWRGVPFSTIRSTCHQVALVLGPQPGLAGNLEEPQYAVVLAHADQVVVHLHDYAAVAPAYRFADVQFRDQPQLVRPHDTRAD